MVLLDKKNQSFNVDHSKSYKVEEDINRDSYYVFLKDCIEDFTKENNIKFASLNFTLPYIENKSEILFLNTPIIGERVLKKGIKYEVEELILEKELAEIHYLWDINEINEEKQEYEMLLSFIEEKIISELLKLKSLKWTINTIKIQPTTIEKLVKNNAIVIDFGHRATRLYFYKGGKLVDVDIISSGGKRLTELIKDELSIADDKEAIEIKHSSYVNDNLEQDYNLSEDIYIQAASLKITDEIKYTVSEIKRLIRAFELQNNLEIDNIYYVGESFNLLFFIDMISNELGVEITPLNSLLPNTCNHIPNKYIFAISAITIDDDYYENLNFSKFSKFHIDFSPIIMGLLCLSIVLHLSFYKIHNEYDNRIDEIKSINTKQEETIEKLNSDIQLTRESQKEDIVLINAIDKIQNQKKWLSDILYILPKKVPNGIILKEININNEEIVLHGYAKDYSSIGFFAIELEKDLKVNINNIESEDNQNIFTHKIEDTDRIKNTEAMTQSFKIILNNSNEN